MKKPNKKVEEMRQRNAIRKAARKKERKGRRAEAIARRANLVEAKKQEMFDKYIAAVNSHFEAEDKKNG
jgi:hypothetical protein